MKTNALSVANYLVECAINENVEIHLLGLIKRVYIVHGFSLAIYDKPAIDSRFDRVEAWKYGPVIPSVYHSFKHYKNDPIKETVVIIEEYSGDKPEFTTPELHDDQIKRVCDMVRKRYRNMNDNDIVKLTHMSGTPWGMCYRVGENNPIPDELTKRYYAKIIEVTTSNPYNNDSH